MSSSTWSTDELVDEAESLSSVKSFILGFNGEDNQHEKVSEEGEVEMEVDAIREWSSNNPPPTIGGVQLGSSRGRFVCSYFITNASLEYLVGQVSLLANTKDVESIKLVVCRTN